MVPCGLIGGLAITVPDSIQNGAMLLERLSRTFRSLEHLAVFADRVADQLHDPRQ